MFKTFQRAAIAFVIGATSLAAIPAANADTIQLSFGQKGAHFTISDRDRHHRGPHWGHSKPKLPACSPRQALRKAERMGLRHVRIIREDRRAIQVSGRSYRDRAMVTFARAPHCPVVRAL